MNPLIRRSLVKWTRNVALPFVGTILLLILYLLLGLPPWLLLAFAAVCVFILIKLIGESEEEVARKDKLAKDRADELKKQKGLV